MRHAPVTPRAVRTRPARVSVKRQGITLLEVVFSLAIFLFSIVALGYLTSSGSERAYQTLQQTLALHLCQSKLAEAAQGVLDLDNPPVGFQAYEGSSDSAFKDFEWQITAAVGDVPELYDVQVTVKRERDGKHVEVSLSQKVFNPRMRGSNADKLPVDPNAAATDSGTQSGTTTK